MTIIEQRVEQAEGRIDRLEAILGQFMTQTGISIQRMDRSIERIERSIERIDRSIERLEAAAAKDREEAALERRAMNKRWGELEALVAKDREEAALERRAMNKRWGELEAAAAKDREEATLERRAMNKRGELEAAAAKDREEAALERRAMNKRWGELANKMGTLVEDIVAPSLRRLAWAELDCGEERFFAERITRVRSDDPSQRREFDALYAGTRAVLLNETKSNARSEDVRDFVNFLRSGEFALYFPELRTLPVVPVFSSLQLAPDLVTYLSRNGIYAVAMGDEAMTILNLDEVRTQPNG